MVPKAHRSAGTSALVPDWMLGPAGPEQKIEPICCTMRSVMCQQCYVWTCSLVNGRWSMGLCLFIKRLPHGGRVSLCQVGESHTLIQKVKKK
jgi:hypothetical protein